MFRFIQNMTARVIAKMACWSVEPMQGQDLQHYLLWLKDQLKVQVQWYPKKSFFRHFFLSI